MQRNEDISLLPEIVASIEDNQRNTENILNYLLSKYPKSGRVMRAQAVFLNEILHDPEQALRFNLFADELDVERRIKRQAKR